MHLTGDEEKEKQKLEKVGDGLTYRYVFLSFVNRLCQCEIYCLSIIEISFACSRRPSWKDIAQTHKVIYLNAQTWTWRDRNMYKSRDAESQRERERYVTRCTGDKDRAFSYFSYCLIR